MLLTIWETLTGPQWYLYISIPIISGLIGWVTNIVAIRMTFYPIEPIGYPPLGWQGIVPSKALKMAGITVDLMTPRLITIAEVFERVDPDRVAQEMEPAFDDLIEPVIEDVMEENSPTVWETVPPWLKEEVFLRLRYEVPRVLKELLEPQNSDSRDPDELISEMRHVIEDSLEPFLDRVMSERSPTVWESMPEELKREVFRRSRNDMPGVISNMFEEWKERIDDIFDLRTMVLGHLEDNKEILNQTFLQVGDKEFQFIERSGLYFGTLFGVLQMIVWVFFQNWWILPLCGLFVGFATNWMALQLIFSPQQPIDVGLFEIQGLFFKRQDEVAEEYGNLVESEILYPENIINNVYEGPKKKEVFKILQKHVHASMDRIGGPINPLLRYIIGPEEYFEMKNKVSDRMMELLPDATKHAYSYLQGALDIGNTLTRKLKSLPPDEFEGILRPAFKEDEWLLILVGAALGMVAGTLQLVFLFGRALPFLT